MRVPLPTPGDTPGPRLSTTPRLVALFKNIVASVPFSGPLRPPTMASDPLTCQRNLTLLQPTDHLCIAATMTDASTPGNKPQKGTDLTRPALPSLPSRPVVKQTSRYGGWTRRQHLPTSSFLYSADAHETAAEGSRTPASPNLKRSRRDGTANQAQDARMDSPNGETEDPFQTPVRNFDDVFAALDKVLPDDVDAELPDLDYHIQDFVFEILIKTGGRSTNVLPSAIQRGLRLAIANALQPLVPTIQASDLVLRPPPYVQPGVLKLKGYFSFPSGTSLPADGVRVAYTFPRECAAYAPTGGLKLSLTRPVNSSDPAVEGPHVATEAFHFRAKVAFSLSATRNHKRVQVPLEVGHVTAAHTTAVLVAQM